MTFTPDAFILLDFKYNKDFFWNNQKSPSKVFKSGELVSNQPISLTNKQRKLNIIFGFEWTYEIEFENNQILIFKCEDRFLSDTTELQDFEDNQPAINQTIRYSYARFAAAFDMERYKTGLMNGLPLLEEAQVEIFLEGLLEHLRNKLL